MSSVSNVIYIQLQRIERMERMNWEDRKQSKQRLAWVNKEPNTANQIKRREAKNV